MCPRFTRNPIYLGRHQAADHHHRRDRTLRARTRAGAPCLMRVMKAALPIPQRHVYRAQNEGWSCPDRRGPAPTVAHLSRDRSCSQQQITGWRSRSSSQSVVVSASERDPITRARARTTAKSGQLPPQGHLVMAAKTMPAPPARLKKLSRKLTPIRRPARET